MNTYRFKLQITDGRIYFIRCEEENVNLAMERIATLFRADMNVDVIFLDCYEVLPTGDKIQQFHTFIFNT